MNARRAISPIARRAKGNMHVKLLTSRISVDENGIIVSHDEGALVELDAAEAQRLIDSGQAEHAGAPAEETANELHADAGAQKRKPKANK